tara:strand:+ start:6457 stop:8370 length:1914 start_codon:yes stop_codon:yes gene_type:complete
MAFRWRPRPKPKPRPVKTKKPTDFSIRESGTSLGELVPTQPLLDIPSPKTTDLPVPVSKTGLADTPEGKEAVKKILTGPEMGRRTFNKGLMGVLQQLFFPTPMPKLSKTKAPVPVPEVKTALTDWSQMKMDLEKIVEKSIVDPVSDQLFDAVENEFYGGIRVEHSVASNVDQYAADRAYDIIDAIVEDIMNWKVREDPKLIQGLINNWKKAEKIQSHEPGVDQLEIGELNYQDDIAKRVQQLIGEDLISGFDKYKDTKKYNKKWFELGAGKDNLKKIPNKPPIFLTAHEMSIERSMDTAWGKEDYRGAYWDPKRVGRNQGITRKIIDDTFEDSKNRLGKDWFKDIIESSMKDAIEENHLLRSQYLNPMYDYSEKSGLLKTAYGKEILKALKEGKGFNVFESRATKYVTDKELKYLDDLFDKYTKGYELPEDLLISFANEAHQYTNPKGYGRAREKRDEMFRMSARYPREFEVQGKGTPHPYLVPLPDWAKSQLDYAKSEERKRRAKEKEKEGIYGDTLIQWHPKKEQSLIESGSKTSPHIKAEDAITELQTTSDPVTKRSAAISDDIVEKITEVQTTPDPITRTIDKKIKKLQEETEFQDRQAQEAKTVKDVKDKFLSRRQLLFPRNKNTGGLVGLY